MGERERGAAFVVQPDEGQSYWQPVPANGYAEVLVSKRNDPSIRDLSAGIQVIAPGSYIREHQHGTEQELLFFVSVFEIEQMQARSRSERPSRARSMRRRRSRLSRSSALTNFWKRALVSLMNRLICWEQHNSRGTRSRGARGQRARGEGDQRARGA